MKWRKSESYFAWRIDTRRFLKFRGRCQNEKILKYV